MVSTKPVNWPARPPRPREDHGFFGPDSPTWRVWTHPTAVLGFQRAIVVETFDPFLAAAVHDQNGVRRDPLGRLQRTFDYFVTVRRTPPPPPCGRQGRGAHPLPATAGRPSRRPRS